MTKYFLGLSMAAVLTVSGAGVLRTQAEETGELEEAAETTASEETEESGKQERIVSSGDAGSGTEEKEKLLTPTGVSWVDWRPAWVAEREIQIGGYFEFELYKDGELFEKSKRGYNPVSEGDSPGTYTYVDLDLWGHLWDIRDNGIYTFRIQALATTSGREDSEWSEFAEEKVYIRPDKQLSTTTCWWDEENLSLVHWEPVENASRYRATLYAIGEDKEEGNKVVENVTSNESCVQSFFYDMAHRGEGKYYATVTALSSSIDTIAHGDEGESSAIYDGTTPKIISDAYEAANGDVMAAAVALAGTEESLERIAEAMQKDAKVLAKIKGLELLYARYISVPSVSEEAGKLIDASKISIVGAALNANDGSILLKVEIPESDKKLDVSSGNYAKSVQLDISLVNNGEAVHDLKVPVTVTIPVPKGIDAAKEFAIVHYSEDGAAKNVDFRKNADGTVTFTVTHFSIFVLAGESSEPEESADPSGSGESEKPSESEKSPKNPMKEVQTRTLLK